MDPTGQQGAQPHNTAPPLQMPVQLLGAQVPALLSDVATKSGVSATFAFRFDNLLALLTEPREVLYLLLSVYCHVSVYTTQEQPNGRGA